MIFSEFIQKELTALIIGKQIGSGQSRTVYQHNFDKTIVIKIEEDAYSYSNALEWEVWRDAKHTPLGKWLAPCVSISPCGGILLMRKISPVTIKEMPEKIPSQFTDLKIENWGRYADRIVCCDYGRLLMNTSVRLKKAEWWSE